MRTQRSRLFPILLILYVVLGVGGCAGLTAADLPAGVKDPASFHTENGALGMYRQAQGDFWSVVDEALAYSGVMTDELEYVGRDRRADSLDARQLPSGSGDWGLYGMLQRVRGQSTLARDALVAYAPNSSPVLRAELFVMQGYAELLLADTFCSGIPLSTIEFDGDFTYQPGSTAEQVYQHAVTLFDSALVLSIDSIAVHHLARLGQARAWLQLGEYARAAQMVLNIPTGYRYEIPMRISAVSDKSNGTLIDGASLADREGGRGFPYYSGTDARIDARSVQSAVGSSGQVVPRFLPAKYAPEGVAHSIVLASGVEARLIEAEAALQAGDVPAWGQALNTLRQTAIIPALPPLPVDSTTDATPILRENVMFHERAYWLFLTGQRQGDLRRRIRVYGRNQSAIYPSLGITADGFIYGQDVTLPIAQTQEGANPHFHGCLSRDA